MEIPIDKTLIKTGATGGGAKMGESDWCHRRRQKTWHCFLTRNVRGNQVETTVWNHLWKEEDPAKGLAPPKGKTQKISNKKTEEGCGDELQFR